MGPILNIFAIYTLEDSAVMQDVLKGIKPTNRKIQVAIWDDDPILKGQVWKPQNESSLPKTDIFLFFISNALMHSEFVQQLEFKMIIDRYKEGKCKVIPILIDDCPWDTAFEADEYTFSFKELRVLPENQKPLNLWNSEEKALKSIVAGLKFEIPVLFEKEFSKESKTEEQIALSFNEEKEEEDLRKVAEEKIRLEAIAAKKRAEEQKLKEEAAKRITDEQRIQAEIDAKKTIEEERIKREKFEAMPKVEAERRSKLEEEPKQREENKEVDSKSKLLKVAGIAALIVLGIWAISKFMASPEEKPLLNSEIKSEETKDSVIPKKSEPEKVAKKPIEIKLTVGDFYKGGMVFSLDKDNKSGMIVHLEDAGPMTWENAMQIHEQLGEGWRLPTFDELLLLYGTVGQGAENSAEFSNGLYWSATDYDQYQAKLLRFRDANRSYHYNKVAEHRKYGVRAIRDFTR